MENIFKLIKLDFMLIKNYIKVIIYLLIISSLIASQTKILVVSLSVAVLIISIRCTSLPFESEERSNSSNIYSIIPIDKSLKVTGRFFSTITLGIISIIALLILEIIIFSFFNIKVTPIQCIESILVGMTVFIFTISLQLPSLFKYGAIKERWLICLIPLILVYAIYFLFNNVSSFKIYFSNFLYAIAENPIKAIILAFILSIIFLLISLNITKRIYLKKE